MIGEMPTAILKMEDIKKGIARPEMKQGG